MIEGRGEHNGPLDEDGLAQLRRACAGDGADAIAARVEDAAVRPRTAARATTSPFWCCGSPHDRYP